MNAVERVIQLRNYLSEFRFNYANESELQRGIEQVLVKKGFQVEREVRFQFGRLDFLIDGEIAIETKIDGSAAELMRQVCRYVQSPDIIGILVVSDRASHVLPEAFNNKPVMVLSLLRGAF
jgi:hypothetical protein